MGHSDNQGELEPRKNFSIRLPAALYDAFSIRAKDRGQSLNNFIGDALAAFVERPDLAPGQVGPDISPNIARDAVRQGPEAIPALKGIATHAAKRDQVNLACVLWAAAARLVGVTEGSVRAAEELNHSAEVAEESKHYELAVALWREALLIDPNNLETANRLGQRLHHLAYRSGDVERYREAERLLARVTFVDNHAKLFHGWSALRVAMSDQAVDQRDRAIAEIDEALKAWAFGQRQPAERMRWLRQVRRLVDEGYQGQAENLIDFANRNARWEPLSPQDLAPLSTHGTGQGLLHVKRRPTRAVNEDDR